MHCNSGRSQREDTKGILLGVQETLRHSWAVGFCAGKQRSRTVVHTVHFNYCFCMYKLVKTPQPLNSLVFVPDKQFSWRPDEHKGPMCSSRFKTRLLCVPCDGGMEKACRWYSVRGEHRCGQIRARLRSCWLPAARTAPVTTTCAPVQYCRLKPAQTL